MNNKLSECNKHVNYIISYSRMCVGVFGQSLEIILMFKRSLVCAATLTRWTVSNVNCNLAKLAA